MSVDAPSQEPVFILSPEQLRDAGRANALYAAALRPGPSRLAGAWKAAWTAVGLLALMALAWAEPWSERVFSGLLARGVPGALIDWAARPLVMVLRGVLFVEAFGYAYHRFFQHLGWFTRRAQVFRRNQRFHWIHHMILYPIGRFYRRGGPYIASEGGLGLSWSVPAALVILAAFALHGFHPATFFFVSAMAGYATFVIDDIHARFHLARHSYQGFAYYGWLEEIHLLHHWDQRTNFTIAHPAMDWLFGTYLAPRRHRRELRAAIEDEELTVSDLINWRYLLLEATPAEHAAFISEARRHPRSLRKIGHLMEVLARRLEVRPDDALAKVLQRRARELLAVLG